MPENPAQKKIFSLLEVMKSIQNTLANRYQSSYWVKAEMNKLNYYGHSGHCYPDLVEKQDEKVIAQVKSVIWKADYVNINDKFLHVLREPLKDGIKILILAKIAFDPTYGLTLRILDIDPGYTLGDLEKEKQDTIRKLKNEGIYDKNKKLKASLLPQRIAIISVDTSKGYADFLQILENNGWGYKFFHYLFPTLLQGDKAVEGIIEQLNRIKKVSNHFDLVAIIRGGGGDIGLSCYNNYALSKEIAEYPIPVLTGIGHATNETVAELVSFFNAITPTKLGEYLIQSFHNFAVPVQDAQKLIIDRSMKMIQEQQYRFSSEAKHLQGLTKINLMRDGNSINELSRTLSQQLQFSFQKERSILHTTREDIKKNIAYTYKIEVGTLKQYAGFLYKDLTNQVEQAKLQIIQTAERVTKESNFSLKLMKDKLDSLNENLSAKPLYLLKGMGRELNNMERNMAILDPQNILKRGFTITQVNGKAIQSTQDITIGDSLSTRFSSGEVISILTEIKDETDE